MNKTLKRTVAGLAVAAGIAGGSFVAGAPAHADTPPPPADLALYGGVNCYWKGWGPTWDQLPGWRMHRFMGAVNIGGYTMTNVTVTELGGATKKVPALTKEQAQKAGAKDPRATKAGELLPGQAYTAFETTWRGCWPSSISGYTIGAQVEPNIFNNAGFWWNIDQQGGDQKAVPNTQKATPTSLGTQAPPAGVTPN
ncbi:hypothetical protein [Gordonia sp. NPDC003429]